MTVNLQQELKPNSNRSLLGYQELTFEMTLASSQLGTKRSWVGNWYLAGEVLTHVDRRLVVNHLPVLK